MDTVNSVLFHNIQFSAIGFAYLCLFGRWLYLYQNDKQHKKDKH
ncbi:hypothetical protein HMPREF1568_0460 [Providencia alcalifaciens PAL-3]|nr:hypothetical protein HMPREF1568_0460 [Providencia alcalifaciens PAL-3]EUD00550.1 hypothetical protein HMPREF1566_3049 [Providencia alcalifaciens PAL-1]